MKITKILALAVLACTASTAFATGTHQGCSYVPPGGTPDPNCTVSWDFTQNNTLQQGDEPALTYTGTSSGTNGGDQYSLVIRGFTIDQSTNNGGVMGKIRDASGIYATDQDGADGTYKYAIGVHALGETTHMGTKIDNYKTNENGSYDTYKVRDAVLLDFQNCIVSIDQISLLKAFYGAGTDFELWAWTGQPDELNFSGNNIDSILPNYMTWDDNPGDWDLVTSYAGYNNNPTVDVASSPVNKSRYFVLVAGDQMGEYNDAFRLAGLRINCDPGNCDPLIPPGGGGGEAPIPGTLALLGIGALATLRRFLKQS